MTSRLIKRRMIKASLRMCMRITPQGNKVTVPFSASKRLYRPKSIVLCYQYTGAHDSGVSYPEDLLNWHALMLVLRLPLDSRLSAQQPARILKKHLSSSTMTPSIDLSHQKQQSSFASAEGVVLTHEYPSNHLVIGLVLRTPKYHLALFQIQDLLGWW